MAQLAPQPSACQLYVVARSIVRFQDRKLNLRVLVKRSSLYILHSLNPVRKCIAHIGRSIVSLASTIRVELRKASCTI